MQDVIHIDRFTHSRILQNACNIGREARIIADLAAVGLEQSVVGRIETDQRNESSNVGLGQVVAEQEVAGQPLFKIVQHVKDAIHRLVIGGLRGRETGLVHTVVQKVVQARVKRLDIL